MRTTGSPSPSSRTKLRTPPASNSRPAAGAGRSPPQPAVSRSCIVARRCYFAAAAPCPVGEARKERRSGDEEGRARSRRSPANARPDRPRDRREERGCGPAGAGRHHTRGAIICRRLPALVGQALRERGSARRSRHLLLPRRPRPPPPRRGAGRRDSHLDFDLEGRTIVLVDDVLYTGRTVRAAIDALFDLRPAGACSWPCSSIAATRSFRSARTTSARTCRPPRGAGERSARRGRRDRRSRNHPRQVNARPRRSRRRGATRFGSEER